MMKKIKIVKFFLFLFSTSFLAFMALCFYWVRYVNLNIDYYLMQLWCNSGTFFYGIKRIRSYGTGYNKDEIGIYVSPHSTFWDIVTMGSEVKGFFVSKAEVVKWPVIGLGAKFVRTVFINRESGIKAFNAMEIASKKIFATGNSVIIFPEGTRSIEHMKPLKSGAFHLSFQTGKPIIPVILKYFPSEILVGTNIKSSFLSQIIKQAIYLKKGSYIHIRKLAPIYPKDFQSVAEMKEHVFKTMDEEYKKI